MRPKTAGLLGERPGIRFVEGMLTSHASTKVGAALSPERAAAPVRISAEEEAARQLLAARAEPSAEERFGLPADADAALRRNALATLLMDLFRRDREHEVFEGLAALMRAPLESRIRMRLHALGLGFDPEEVLQDTLVNVYSYPDRFDPQRPGAFRAWSSTIVDNVIRRQLRKMRSGPDLQFRPDEQLVDQRDIRSRGPAQRAEQSEECQAAFRSLALLLGCYLEAYQALGERERFILQMVEVEGMRYAELAEVLEIRPEAVKMAVFRARRRIHERLTVMFSRANTGAIAA